jgi:chromosome segregation ATPase
MPTSQTKMILTAFIALVIAFSGCSHTMNSGNTTNELASQPQPVANDRYSREISELNQVILKNSKSAAAKNAHLKLAQLYSNHKNHLRNYQKSLNHLKFYIILEESTVDGETLDWMASLKEIDRLSKEIAAQQQQIRKMENQLKKSKKEKLALGRTNQKLTREEINLREKNRKLEESNQNLRKTIEMLKNLDQRLEEKRKNFNN